MKAKKIYINETQANNFAAELLIPTDMLEMDIKKGMLYKDLINLRGSGERLIIN